MAEPECIQTLQCIAVAAGAAAGPVAWESEQFAVDGSFAVASAAAVAIAVVATVAVVVIVAAG